MLFIFLAIGKSKKDDIRQCTKRYVKDIQKQNVKISKIKHFEEYFFIQLNFQHVK